MVIVSIPSIENLNMDKTGSQVPWKLDSLENRIKLIVHRYKDAKIF